MRARRQIGLAAAVLCVAAGGPAAGLERPVTVSPGGTAVVEAAPAACPTFSWGGVAKARSYEIVVYEMAGAEPRMEAPGERPALAVTVPGSASSWTPPADRCLAAATAHVWFVRALGERGEVGAWSRGGMFRTPAAASAEALEQAVVRIARQLLRSRAAAAAPRGRLPVSPAAGPFGRAASSTPAAEAPGTQQPAGSAAVGLQAERPETLAVTTFGVYGISNSSADESSGVVGYASATSGDVRGVSGFSRSPDGNAIYGESTPASGGIAIVGVDDPDTDTEASAAVVGVTENVSGYGGFFWNFDGGDVLAVGNPEPFEIKFVVDADGNVEADGDLDLGGVIGLDPTDTPPGCDGLLEGSMYYDASESWLCICTETASDPLYGWRRADDPTDDCST